MDVGSHDETAKEVRKLSSEIRSRWDAHQAEKSEKKGKIYYGSYVREFKSNNFLSIEP